MFVLARQAIAGYGEAVHISNDDTICAIVTPIGVGGLGVIRLSGPDASKILSGLWHGRIPVSEFEPRKMYLGKVSKPGTRNPGPEKPPLILPSPPRGEGQGEGVPGPRSRVPHPGLLDRAMAVLMPAPHTYTGEDVVEISAHGSPIVLRQILNACIVAGARPAIPGEFTKRAFLAGKIDLAQAEAVADLIAATSERGARIAADNLAGRLSAEIRAIAEAVAELRTEVEASIDFPDEAFDRQGPQDTDAPGDNVLRLKQIVSDIEQLAATFNEGRLLREGVRVAIVGRPNVGKSSIFNRLVGSDRAIVHKEPGTTRDVVEETIVIDGLAYRLRDTAGIRNARDEVESLGIEKTRAEIGAADVVLAIFDGSRPFDDEDRAIYGELGTVKTLAVINKSDLPVAFSTQDIALVSLHAPIEASAKTGEGFEAMANRLVEVARSYASAHDGAIVTNARQKKSLDDAGLSLANALASVNRCEPLEFTAQHLRMALDLLGEITGETTADDILDRIFSRFCIGK